MSVSWPRCSLSRPEDHVYYERVRDILSAPPCKGLPNEPDQCLPHVFLGSQLNAESLRLLRKYGITHVLNCAGYKGARPDPHASPYQGLDIDYYEFQAEDDETYNITQHFMESFNYLDGVRRCGGRALVHCALGINRSAAIVAAYMMVTSYSTLLDVINTLKRKRHLVLSNHGFQRQLVRFARTRGLLDELPASAVAEEETHAERWEHSLPRHRDAFRPEQEMRRVLESDVSRRWRPMSGNFEVTRNRNGYDGGDPGPSFTYESVGRRAHVVVPGAGVGPGQSVFEQYMMKHREFRYDK